MTDQHPSDRDFDRDDDLRDRLRAADPAASLRPAEPEGLARLLEDTMSHDTETQVPETRQTGTRGRSPLTWVVAAAAAVVIAGVGVFALTGNDDESAPPVAGGGAPATEQTVTQLGAAPGAGQARCMAPTAQVLATKELAFAGTVDSIEGGTVTLTPTTFYAGEETDLVEVAAPAEEMQALIGAVDFQVGQSYLVSAADGDVTVCGFSGPATPELQRMYDEAFAG